jgi:ABC-type Zn2+ transport system substrate-binding protein/surface adhesin
MLRLMMMMMMFAAAAVAAAHAAAAASAAAAVCSTITYITPLGSLLGACIIGRSVSIRPKKGSAQLLRSANYE